MKLVTLLIALIILSGCVTTMPKDQQTIETKVKIEHDTFKDQTWISTPLYLSRQGFTDTFPVNIKLRSLYKNRSRVFIQLYVTKMDVTWGFYHSANGEDGYKFDFVKVDGEVDSSGGMVTTNEHFALGMSSDYLEKMSNKDWKIKVYGQRNEGVFIVPKNLTNAFLAKLNCFESGACK